MGEWLADHIGPIAHVVIGVVSVALLAFLTWGIGMSNLTAAMVAGGGLAVIIVMGGSILLVPDNLRSQATERMLRVASLTLVHMRDGLNPQSCAAVCQVLLPETQASAIAMTDDVQTLAYVGDQLSLYQAGTLNSAPTREVLTSGRVQTFTGLDRLEWADAAEIAGAQVADERGELYPAGIIAPLVVSGRTVGTVKLFYRHGNELDRMQIAIARGLAELLSTQLTVSELDRQAELAAQAELRALQAQINPHFLFNTLNTISAFTRTDPTKARDLMREFSVFYRRTLESSQTTIPLSAELEQTRRYIHIEQARFGEDRIVLTERVEEGCGDVEVPGFIVQPLVENAVRHALRDEGPLHIDVQATTDGSDLLIAVADDGLGMDESVAGRLLEGPMQEAPHKGSGTGVALRNVAERIELFYGVGSGVEIMSKLGEGSVITLRLVGAAPLRRHQLK